MMGCRTWFRGVELDVNRTEGHKPRSFARIKAGRLPDAPGAHLEWKDIGVAYHVQYAR